MLRFLFVFFFQCYGDHRDLHSFPTRRSSDLDALPTGGVRSRSMLSHWLLTLPTGSRSSTQTCLGPSLPESVDRKSTRLNSSHGYISYAVFCLKKKKKKHIVHKRQTTCY